MEIYCRIGQKKKEAADYAEQFFKCGMIGVINSGIKRYEVTPGPKRSYTFIFAPK